MVSVSQSDLNKSDLSFCMSQLLSSRDKVISEEKSNGFYYAFDCRSVDITSTWNDNKIIKIIER